MLMYQEILT